MLPPPLKNYFFLITFYLNFIKKVYSVFPALCYRSLRICQTVLVLFHIDLESRRVQLNGPPEVDLSKKRRGVRFSDSGDLPKPKLAFAILKYVFRHPLNKSIVLRKCLAQVHELKDLLKVSKVQNGQAV